MGDHRASIKIEMEFHGVKKSADMWINYWLEGEYYGVDDRIIEFIREVYEQGMDNYYDIIAEAKKRKQEEWQEQHKQEIEAAEKEQLKRLKEKYEPYPLPPQ